PAVVRIITEFSGHLTVNFTPTNSVTFPQGLGKAYQQAISGSGAFITAHGDILTADHVVNPPPDVLQQVAAGDVTTYINQHPELGLGQVTPTQVAQALLSGQIASSATYDVKRSVAFLSTDYTGPLSAVKLSEVPQQFQAPVDKIEKESAVDQKDVAIVHAAFTGFDTPSIQLGDSSSVQQQDELTIIGFPGNGDVSMKPTDFLTSSVNKINVSSIKTTDTGAPVIQVGGNVEHGDSGGPALDSKGSVVGIVSFGLATSADTSGGTSFLQASNSARDLVQSLNLDTTPGQFQKLWNQAFTDYALNTAGHWHKAQQEFTQLATNYPQFKAITPYLNFAQTQASTEQTTQVTPTPQHGTSSSTLTNKIPAIAWTVGAVAVIVLLVILLFGVVLRGRKKKTLPAPGKQVNRQPTSIPSPNHGDDGMAAFGAPPKKPAPAQTNTPPAPRLPNTPPSVIPPASTVTLRAWPCGHMNRPNARFCSVCGEPAPEPPTRIRRVEQ
ncbi:MAG: trypsin-like peptidase domain-containing protein, partial [Chloroflexi bacterium]|nr:trypsin-like peptidase domain-containing protein [Chloroflexota bacterium]